MSKETFVKLSQELVNALRRAAKTTVGRWQDYYLADSGYMILFKLPGGPERLAINRAYKLIICASDSMGFDSRPVVFLVPTPAVKDNTVLCYNEAKKDGPKLEFGVGPVFRFETENDDMFAVVFGVAPEHIEFAKQFMAKKSHIEQKQHRMFGIVDLDHAKWFKNQNDVWEYSPKGGPRVYDHRTLGATYNEVAIIVKVKRPDGFVFFNLYAPREGEFNQRLTHELNDDGLQVRPKTSSFEVNSPDSCRTTLGDRFDFGQLKELVLA